MCVCLLQQKVKESAQCQCVEHKFNICQSITSPFQNYLLINVITFENLKELKLIDILLCILHPTLDVSMVADLPVAIFRS